MNDINKILEILRANGYYVTSPEGSDTYDWRESLDKTKNGQIRPTYKNHTLIFENVLKGDTLRYNEFERVIEYNGKRLDNTTISILRNTFEREGGFRCKEVTRDWLTEYSYTKRYDPVKEYLSGLQWDGKKRIETMFIDWFGVDDTPVNRKLAEKWMVSGVKRIFEPGCLIEGMIILVGEQGLGKSTFAKRLAKGYGIEAGFDIREEKKCIETFNGGWIVNFDELKSIIKSDPETAKAMLTRQSDTSRLAYREESESYPRHCIFMGSTNDTSILKDYTGKIERRYWVMECHKTDKRYIYDNFTADVVDQLWAEAYSIYMNTPNYNISISDFTDEETEALRVTQRDFKTYAEDDLVEELREILNDRYALASDGTFMSKEDFKKQVIGNGDYDTSNNLFNTIDAIPFSYLNYVIQQHYKTTRPNKWLSAALEDEWEDMPKYNYGGSRVRCLVRKQV